MFSLALFCSYKRQFVFLPKITIPCNFLLQATYVCSVNIFCSTVSPTSVFYYFGAHLFPRIKPFPVLIVPDFPVVVMATSPLPYIISAQQQNPKKKFYKRKRYRQINCYRIIYCCSASLARKQIV